MKFKMLSAMMLLTLVVLCGASSPAEARCYKSFNVGVGNYYSAPCYTTPCERVIVGQRQCAPQPTYVPPPARTPARVCAAPAPVYVPAQPVYVYPQPVYREVYVCPAPRPNYYTNLNFGWSWR